MRKSYILIAVAMIAALSMTGCKNNKKNQNQEPTQEEIQAQKQALADSVLAKIDSLAAEYIDAYDSSFNIKGFELADAEKMIKPDYLLDPSEASKFVTKSQKVNALAIYLIELLYRDLYDIPVDESKDVIARLAVDVNYPVDFSTIQSDAPSDRIRRMYNKCKENGDIAYFWQLQNAFLIETTYLIAQNPDLFFSRVTDEQWEAYSRRVGNGRQSDLILSENDEEIATLFAIYTQYPTYTSKEEFISTNSSKESAKQFRIDHKETYIARRNALLQ